MPREAVACILLGLFLVSSGCVQSVSEETELQAAGEGEASGYRLVNASVWTSDEANPWASAVAIEGDEIVAVGSDAEVREADVGPRPVTVDLEDRMVLPGFHDTHTHITRVARDADPNGPNPFAPWQPDRDPVDRLVSNQLVAAEHTGTYAQRNAERASQGQLPFPPSDSQPAGHGSHDHGLEHRDAMTDLGPWTGEGNDRETWLQMMRLGLETSSRFGITSHVEAGAPLEVFEVYESLDEAGELDARFNVYVFPESLDEVVDRGWTMGQGDERARLLGLKIYSDGWMGPRTAALQERYEDRPHRGLIFYAQPEVDELALEAHRNGLKVTAHSIGDRATDRMLTAFERALAEGCGPEANHTVCEDPRFSLEHAQLTPPHLIERMQAIDLVPSIQLSFATSDSPWAEDAIGEERLRHAYAWRTMVEAGLTVAGSSDFPIEVLPPLWGLERVVTRQDVDGYPAGGFLPEEALALEQALKALTINAAYLEHREDEVGSLTPGKLADVVVLDRDLFEIPAEQIHETNVEATLVGGEVVHATDELAESGLASGS